MYVMDPKIERVQKETKRLAGMQTQKETKCLAGMQTQATSKSNSQFTN